MTLLGVNRAKGCGPDSPSDPGYLKLFRSCSPELERQWQEGCRFQDYEKEQNCLLWQRMTSSSIPLRDIEKVVYDVRLSELKDLSKSTLSDNKFAKWLSAPGHKEDLDYIRTAKEIEELREYLNNPWYYAYEGDEEHSRLEELTAECRAYTGRRHASRYALQLARLYIASKDYRKCIELWENSVSAMPQDLTTDMTASYVGGAYLRTGNRDKAIELFKRSQDIGSLINLKAWDDEEAKSAYTDKRVRELEYIFNRYPDSPLLSVKLQKFVRNREDFVYGYDEWAQRGFHDPVTCKLHRIGDSWEADDEHTFYSELKRFAHRAIASPKCHQKGMWNYALGYLYYLDGDLGKANTYLMRAERSDCSPFIKESLRAFRFLLDAHYANNSKSYLKKLMRDIEWLDERMVIYANLRYERVWQYDNKMNWPFYYWQDVARKVLLGVVCPRLEKCGNMTLALQLANYASNRIYQISPLYETQRYNPSSQTWCEVIMPMDEYRKEWEGRNYFDWQSQFFDWLYSSKADDAAKYARTIEDPKTALDKYLNDRGYVDTDYIYDIVGTMYLREMNYEKAVYWLSKVATDYQSRTNIAKQGYFDLDPFKFQSAEHYLIADSSDYKLRFAQEMNNLERTIKSDAEINRRADAKIRYATGLRNSFGECWYLTTYGFNSGYSSDADFRDWKWLTTADREGFKNNPYAQKAYKRVDAMIKEAIGEYTNPEKAAQAQLAMMNHKTIISKYPDTRAADYVRSRCDNYYDYCLQMR